MPREGQRTPFAIGSTSRPDPRGVRDDHEPVVGVGRVADGREHDAARCRAGARCVHPGHEVQSSAVLKPVVVLGLPFLAFVVSCGGSNGTSTAADASMADGTSSSSSSGGSSSGGSSGSSSGSGSDGGSSGGDSGPSPNCTQDRACSVEGMQCPGICGTCTCTNGTWACPEPPCATPCRGPAPQEGDSCGGVCCGPYVGLTCSFGCGDAGHVSATCEAVDGGANAEIGTWHLQSACVSPGDAGADIGGDYEGTRHLGTRSPSPDDHEP
jgi:hypothetical protein